MDESRYFRGRHVSGLPRKMSEKELEKVKRNPRYKWMFDLWEEIKSGD